MSDATITKSKLFKEDIALATGGTGAVETGTRLTSAGGVVTLTKLDLGHIPYRSFAGTPEDLLDGGQDIDILPHDIDAGGDCNIDGTLTVGGVTTLSNLSALGYVKNSATGVLSTGAIAAADLPTAIDALKIGAGLVSDTEFGYLNNAASNIQTQLNTIVAGVPASPLFAILQNRQALGTNGGTATGGVWDAARVIPLNVEYEDASNIVDFSAPPAFTLQAGTYRIEAYSKFYATSRSQIRLYKITAPAGVAKNVGTYDMVGTSVFAYYTESSQIEGTITIAAPTQFSIEYRTAGTIADSGLGLECSFDAEVYAQVKITKTA